jgi:membrane-anchored glycerophosphoryl diester phosphodiesterase (GDPDase)
MNILKKIAGIIILLFAILLCFPAAYAFPIQFENCRKKFEDEAMGAPGSAIAFLICFVFYVLLTYFLIKLSLKLIRKKKINATSIDEIGIE